MNLIKRMQLACVGMSLSWHDFMKDEPSVGPLANGQSHRYIPKTTAVEIVTLPPSIYDLKNQEDVISKSSEQFIMADHRVYDTHYAMCIEMLRNDKVAQNYIQHLHNVIERKQRFRDTSAAA